MDKLIKFKYFLLAFALAFFVLAVILLTLMNVSRPGAQTAAPVREIEEPAYSPLPEDALSVLFIGEEEDGAGTFLLARFDPANGKVPLTVFPPGTAVTNSGKRESLASVYRYGGAGYAKEALSAELKAPIDRYVIMNGESFVACAGAIGSVEFDLPEAVTSTRGGVAQTLKAGRQLLDGLKAAAVLRYGDYPGGEAERCRVAGELAAAIIDQRRDICASTMADSIFEKTINLIGTDISYADYHVRREAAVYMAKLPGGVAEAIEAAGSYSEDGLFVLSDTFLALISQTLN